MPNNELGDFQTPLALARQCLRVLGLPAAVRVLEPTCGRGAFLEASASLSPGSERVGLELQEEHAAAASAWGRVHVGNVFTTRLPDAVTWESDAPLVVVGNPPWVTSAQLDRLGSANVPPKDNFKGARGIDAILGSANFDVAEFVILKVIAEYAAEPFRLGMLCKTQVARNVVAHAAAAGLPLAGAALYRIDAMRWFGAGVDACWFVVDVDPERPVDHTVAVRDDLFAPETPPATRFGVVDGRMVADVDRYAAVRDADGTSPYEWRSGLKHDASAVFELVAGPEPTTRDGTVADVEASYLFPLLKSTDLFRGRHRTLARWVIVPQTSFGAETASLEQEAPRLWAHLTAHGAALDGRRSSIYRNRPRFSVFGHGPYTYAPYKVAVSGLHKQAVFRLVVPLGGQPVVLDDTCYFLPFTSATEAAVVTALLDSAPCRALVESLVFWDSKRPVTKRLLARLDLRRLPRDRDRLLTEAARLAAEADVGFDPAEATRLIG